MDDFENKLNELNQDLFRAIPSQNTTGDRETLLALQRIVRTEQEYVYLEIGSHLGGTIQPHYADPRCRLIYSVDKRPLQQPDERGQVYAYPENSTQAMRENLKRAYPSVDESKLLTFDCDAREMNPSLVQDTPAICFIDGEHTNEAVLSDFAFCRKVIADDGIIATHDSGVVFAGIQQIKQLLQTDGVSFQSMKLGGSVYAFCLGPAASARANALAFWKQDEDYFFRSSAFYLRRQRCEAKLASYSLLLKLYRGIAIIKDALYDNLYLRVIRVLKGERHG